jgi:hypothetical protein
LLCIKAIERDFFFYIIVTRWRGFAYFAALSVTKDARKLNQQ